MPLAAYVLVGCSLYGIQRSLVFHPRQGVPEQAEAAGMVPVKATAADGVTVVHWYAPAQPGQATVVLFHGNGGTVTALGSWATALRARGLGVVLADYRGYSGNPGMPSEEGLYADARAILDWVAAHGIDDRHTVLLGWSLGTGIAVQMAIERPVAGVVLLAPYTSIVDVGARRYPIFPVSLLMRDRFDSMSKIAGVHAPVMVVTGERDLVVPPDMGHALFAAAHEPKRALFLPETGHLITPSTALAAVAGFLEEQKVAAAPPR
ncbi:MAG TPA: alpha/beta hydrolase [Stellaceae bacterium]|nr:alpha/beta hydrolase [Stellaceae bacterium]